MARTSLLIMATGIGSCFGTGIRQLEPVGLSDERVMAYSIHDAMDAGFDKIINVIRKNIEEIPRRVLAAVQNQDYAINCHHVLWNESHNV